MTDASAERRRWRLDAIRVRCIIAFVLGLVSLVLVILDLKFSLLPFVVAFSLLTYGPEIKGRNAPPITFLVLVPVMVVIAIIMIRRH